MDTDHDYFLRAGSRDRHERNQGRVTLMYMIACSAGQDMYLGQCTCEQAKSLGTPILSFSSEAICAFCQNTVELARLPRRTNEGWDMHTQIRNLYQRYDEDRKRLALHCPVCGNVIRHGHGHLHHWLIKRGRLSKDRFDEINVPENLIMLHADCHVPQGKGQTQDTFTKCRKAALKVWGDEHLTGWYNNIGIGHIESILDL